MDKIYVDSLFIHVIWRPTPNIEALFWWYPINSDWFWFWSCWTKMIIYQFPSTTTLICLILWTDRKLGWLYRSYRVLWRFNSLHQLKNKAVSVLIRVHTDIYVVAIFLHYTNIFTFWCFHGAIDSFPSSGDDASTVDRLVCWLQASDHLPDDDTHHFVVVDHSITTVVLIWIFLLSNI